MNPWSNRYALPGWFFLGTLAALLWWMLPDPKEQWIGKGSIAAVVPLAGLVAGLPLGYLVNTVFEIFFALCGGTGTYVHHGEFAAGLRRICSSQANSQPHLAVAKLLETGCRKQRERAVYVIFWQSLSKEFRASSERRWESCHASWGIITAFILAFVSAGMCACVVGKLPEFWCADRWILVPMALCAVPLWFNARQLRKQAADQENLWLSMLVASLEAHPDDVFKVFGATAAQPPAPRQGHNQ